MGLRRESLIFILVVGELLNGYQDRREGGRGTDRGMIVRLLPYMHHTKGRNLATHVLEDSHTHRHTHTDESERNNNVFIQCGCETQPLVMVCLFQKNISFMFDLHWLPIRYIFTFKICIQTYQAYYRTVPSYLCDLIVPYVNAWSVRSNDKFLIKPCKPRLRSYSETCLKYAGPQ